MRHEIGFGFYTTLSIYGMVYLYAYIGSVWLVRYVPADMQSSKFLRMHIIICVKYEKINVI